MPFGRRWAELCIYRYFSCQERNRNHWPAGTIEPDFMANLVLLTDNPLEDIRATRATINVSSVLKCPWATEK